jgi:predicted ester cyclase
MKQYILRDLTAFPDVHFTIEDQIAEGNKVALATPVMARTREILWVLRPLGNR